MLVGLVGPHHTTGSCCVLWRSSGELAASTCLLCRMVCGKRVATVMPLIEKVMYRIMTLHFHRAWLCLECGVATSRIRSLHPAKSFVMYNNEVPPVISLSKPRIEASRLQAGARPSLKRLPGSTVLVWVSSAAPFTCAATMHVQPV